MTGEEADKKSAVRSKKAVQKPEMPGKRAGRQGTAVQGGLLRNDQQQPVPLHRRSAGRQEARDAKQTGRQEGRDAKHGGGEEK